MDRLLKVISCYKLTGKQGWTKKECIWMAWEGPSHLLPWESLMPSSFIIKPSLVSQIFYHTCLYVWFPNCHLFMLTMRSDFPEMTAGKPDIKPGLENLWETRLSLLINDEGITSSFHQPALGCVQIATFSRHTNPLK